MNVKEITLLRKSGKLREALDAAEEEFRSNQNRYTVGALFWCLNDLYKTQDKEASKQTIERMRYLHGEYGTGDELMYKAMKAANKRGMTKFDEINTALVKAKEGKDMSGVFSTIREVYASGDLDSSLFPDLGWLIYYTLKHSSSNESYNRKLLLSYYLKLGLTTPSLLHSRILSEAIRLEQESPLQFRIRDFIRLWGLENLREEDWNQFKTDMGHTLPSLVEKLIGVYAKEVKTDGIEAPEEFVCLVDKALNRYPLNQNMPYFKAITLISRGKREESIKYYKELILKYPSKYYLWGQIAELVENDPDTKIGLLCKAMSQGTEDIFLGAIRLRLSQLLITKGLYAEANYELGKYKEVYTSQGWKLKSDYWQLIDKLTDCTPLESNQLLYNKYTPKAEEFIYNDLPSVLAVKISDRLLDDKNRPGRKLVQWVLKTKEGVYRLKKPVKFGLEKAKNGTAYDVKIRDGRIVWIKPSQENLFLQDWIKHMEGTIKLRTDRKGKTYSILKGVYVEERLLKRVEEGRNVRIIAISQADGRWTAISLTKC